MKNRKQRNKIKLQKRNDELIKFIREERCICNHAVIHWRDGDIEKTTVMKNQKNINLYGESMHIETMADITSEKQALEYCKHLTREIDVNVLFYVLKRYKYFANRVNLNRHKSRVRKKRASLTYQQMLDMLDKYDKINSYRKFARLYNSYARSIKQ